MRDSMATQPTKTTKPRQPRQRSSGNLGTATAPKPATARRPRLLDATLRDLDARQQGYILVRKHLDWSLAECETEAGHDERVVAGMLAAVLCMRTLLAGEMERVTAQTRILLAMRAESAA